MAACNNANIIRKVQVVQAAGHHGGAWKVAYADFMTAMMAFFLLMWILSSSDAQKLKGIAEYFSTATMPGGTGVLKGATIGPLGTLSASNGAKSARGSENGKVDSTAATLWKIKDVTRNADPAEKVPGTNKGRFDLPAGGDASRMKNSAATPNVRTSATGLANGRKTAGAIDSRGKQRDSIDHKKDDRKFAKLEQDIRQAMQASQDLRPLMKNVIFQKTPEGLRIQVIDQKGHSMFPRGSDKLSKSATYLMTELGKSLSSLPNKVVITGHTDSVPFTNSRNFDNWDLSTNRANAVRHLLKASGVATNRFTRVSGLADTEPLDAKWRDNPANRRISLLLSYNVLASVEANSTDAGPDMRAQSPETRPSDQAATIMYPTKGADAGSTIDAPPAAGVRPVVNEARTSIVEGGGFESASNDPIGTLDAQIFDNLRSALQ